MAAAGLPDAGIGRTARVPRRKASGTPRGAQDPVTSPSAGGAGFALAHGWACRPVGRGRLAAGGPREVGRPDGPHAPSSGAGLRRRGGLRAGRAGPAPRGPAAVRDRASAAGAIVRFARRLLPWLLQPRAASPGRLPPPARPSLALLAPRARLQPLRGPGGHPRAEGRATLPRAGARGPRHNRAGPPGGLGRGSGLPARVSPVCRPGPRPRTVLPAPCLRAAAPSSQPRPSPGPAPGLRTSPADPFSPELFRPICWKIRSVGRPGSIGLARPRPRAALGPPSSASPAGAEGAALHPAAAPPGAPLPRRAARPPVRARPGWCSRGPRPSR